MTHRLIAAALCFSLLAACGQSGDSTPASLGPDATVPPASPTAAMADGAGSPRPASFAQCATCHAVQAGKNGIGPSLAGVFDAKAGHIGNYAYSSAMRGSGLVWDEPTLDAYIAQPMAKVPGTKMSFPGVKDAGQRAEIIAYLKTL